MKQTEHAPTEHPRIPHSNPHTPPVKSVLDGFLTLQRSGEKDRVRTRTKASLVPPLPKICHTIIGAIPRTMVGESRVRFLADQVNSLLDTDKTKVRFHMEYFTRRMLDQGASDLAAGGPACNGKVWYRIDGNNRPQEEMGIYTQEETDMLFLSLLNEGQMALLFEEYSIDFSYSLRVEGKDGRPRRFRATIYFDYDHLALNMRAITDEVRPFSSYTFHSAIRKGLMFRHVRDGLTLVTGVTGSGKSTTLDAIVDANNADVPGNIVVIGRPIEYMHQSKKCLVRHREVGKDVRTFKEGIVQALRQDPDIVVIGEMRDPETISAALEITDSGHKVFSTLHTSSAVESLDRIVAEYPTDEQERIRNRLADTLRCIVSQKLLPKFGGGRVLAKEVLWMTPSSRAAIKNDNSSEIYQMMWEGAAIGMNTLEQDLFRLLQQRLITMETAFDFANNKRRLKQLTG